MLVIKTNQKCQTLSLIFHAPSADSVTVTEHSALWPALPLTIWATDQTSESSLTVSACPDSVGDRTTSFVSPQPWSSCPAQTTLELHNCRTQLSLPACHSSPPPPCFARVINSNVENKRRPDIVLEILCWTIQPPERCWSVEFLFMPELNTGQSHQENCIKLNCQTMTAGWHIFVASSTEIGIEQI